MNFIPREGVNSITMDLVGNEAAESRTSAFLRLALKRRGVSLVSLMPPKSHALVVLTSIAAAIRLQYESFLTKPSDAYSTAIGDAPP